MKKIMKKKEKNIKNENMEIIEKNYDNNIENKSFYNLLQIKAKDAKQRKRKQ